VTDNLAPLLLDIKYFLFRCYINRLEREREYWKTLKEIAIHRIQNYDADYEMRLIKQELADRIQE
jgi:hypothetical protein